MVFVTGDTHGDSRSEMRRFNSRYFPEGKELTKEDVVIIVGDFGFIFNNKRTNEEQHWLNWLHEKPWTTLFLDGNHDNHDLLAQLPTQQLYGDTVGVVNNSVFHLKRGSVYDIEDQTFFVFGGANSIDKNMRTEGRDWWKSEEPNHRETSRGLQRLAEHDWKVDYVLTHDAPTYVRNKMFSHHSYEENSVVVRYLDHIFPLLHFKHHYFGHHHKDVTVYDKHTCCYNKIHHIPLD